MRAKDDFNKVNRYGTNALIRAIEKNKIEDVADMIYRGADVHFRTTPRDVVLSVATRVPYAVDSTPLHAACLQGTPGIAALLIEHGADVNAKNADGQTPLDYAILSLAYYETQHEKKLASKFTPQRFADRAMERAERYEDIIRALLDADAKPGVFALPERFGPYVRAKRQPRPAARFYPPPA
jgi:hypothetical protein